MLFLRILGILLLIAGGVSIGASQYIKQQVLEGRAQISEGEQKVRTGKAIFGLTPVPEEVSNPLFFGSAESQIAEGKSKADRYEILATQLQIGGIIAIAVGAACILCSFFKKRK